MRAVLFEGTPEEFARVEAMFRAGGNPALQSGLIVLPRSRPRTWPELNDEHCHQFARRVLEVMPERVREALGLLAEAQAFHAEQTIEEWAEYAEALPEELCGYLAERGRCTSRAFIELFGCENAPERVKGAARMLVQKIPSPGGAYVVLRPGLTRAMADLGMLDPLDLEQDEAPEAPTDAPRPAPRPAGSPKSVDSRRAMPAPARPAASRQSSPPGGSWVELGRVLSGFLDPEAGKKGPS